MPSQDDAGRGCTSIHGLTGTEQPPELPPAHRLGRPQATDSPASASAGKEWRGEGLSWHLLCAAVSLNPTNTCTVPDEETEVQEDGLTCRSSEGPAAGVEHGSWPHPLLPGLSPPLDRNPLEGRG